MPAVAPHLPALLDQDGAGAAEQERRLLVVRQHLGELIAHPRELGLRQAAPSSGAKGPAGKRDDTIPDDYSLTESDCDALGKQYGEVATSDQMAPLNEKQRKASEAGIEKVVSKLQSQWIEGCQQSLAGNIVDRKVLKCAMGSRTVAEFKTCLGDDSTAAKPGGKPKKK